MLPKWVYPLLILFVVFFILSNPESAGPQTRSFFGWIGDQAAAAGTFFDGLFGDDDPNSNVGTPPTSIESGVNGEADLFNTSGSFIELDSIVV